MKVLSLFSGVASPVAEWVGRHIMAAEHGAP